MNAITERLARTAVAAAESGRVPDRLVRLGMDRVVAGRLKTERENRASRASSFADGPIAVHTDLANEQHYEVPSEFYELVLGPHLKYSSAYWPDGVGTLAEAEEAMLSLSAERAGIENGQRVLDLGCGWGSFSLWAAAAYPDSRITAVSNSHSQKVHIDKRAADLGLSNVEVITANIADFRPDGRFDRIVSIEMLEHVRNHREVFHRMRSWIEPDGAAFVHVFAHREYAYPFEVEGPTSWMAQTFFTGGVMPSRTSLPEAADPDFALEDDWWLDGTHYAKTLEAWLERFDARRDAVRAVFEPVYGSETAMWMQRWRMFFMACSQMFGYGRGGEWGVAHHRLVPRR